MNLFRGHGIKFLVPKGWVALIAAGLLVPCSTAPLLSVNTGSVGLTVRVDGIPPAGISDLLVQKATGTEGGLIFNWTEPGDDGMSGQASLYRVVYSTSGNINNLSDFYTSTVTVFNSGWTPGPGGGVRAQTVTGLIPGLTYYFAINAQDSVGLNGFWSRNGVNLYNWAAADQEPPGNVTGVTALAGNMNVSLSWSDLTPAQKTADWNYYRIYRSTYSNFNFQTISTQTTSASYLDNQVTNGVTYFYRVVGVVQTPAPYFGNMLESLSWSTTTATPNPPLPLGPSNLTTISVGTNTITWQWQNNATTQTGFNIYAGTGGLITSVGSTTVTFIQTGLAPGASEAIFVKSFNTLGESTGSANFSRFTQANPPIGLMESTATTTTASLIWNSNNNASGVTYIVEQCTTPCNGTTNVFSQIGAVTGTTFISMGLVELTTYTFRLHAQNGEGVNTAYAPSIDTATTMMPPGVITTLTASPGQSRGTVNLQWLAPGDDGTTGNIGGGLYDIRWSTNNIATDNDFNLIPQTTGYQKLISTNTVLGSQQGILLTGLNFNGKLYFAIKTQDAIPGNFSGVSNTANMFFTLSLTSPSAITNLAAVLTSSVTARLTWTAPGDNAGVDNNQFGGYDVRYSTNPIPDLPTFLAAPYATAFGTVPAPPQAPGIQEAMFLNGLSLNTTYYFAVRAFDGAPFYSSISNGATFYTPDLIPPGPVQNLMAVANTAVGKRIDLSWVNPAVKKLNGVRIIVRTDMFAQGPTDSTGTRFDLTISSPLMQPPTTFYQNGLTLGLTYYYTVFTFDGAPGFMGISGPNYSTPVFASTQPLATQLPAPAKPKNVRGVRSGDGSAFTISWDPVTTRITGDPLGPVELSSYAIYRMGTPIGTTNQIFSVPASSVTLFADTSLAGNIYFYKVRAVNVGGTQSPDSEIVSSDVDGTVYVMMDDGISYISMPGSEKVFLDQNNLALSGARVPSEEGDKTFKAMNVLLMDSKTGQEKKGFIFNDSIKVALGYLVDAGGKVTNGAPAMNFSQALPSAKDAPKSFSIYWFNGMQWLKLGTTVDPNNQVASVKARHAGAYQLRLVQQSLNVQANTVYPRTITPNGDGINDVCFFFFENPTDASVKGTVFDLKSAKVASLKVSDIFAGNNTVLTWDGKDDSGAVVTGGIYMYKIDIGDRSFTGTVAVAR